jgi:hypothetical protein
MLREINILSRGDTMQPVWTTDLAEALAVSRREALVIAHQLHEDGFVNLWGVDSEDRGKVRITGRGIKECERKARSARKRRRTHPRKPAPPDSEFVPLPEDVSILTVLAHAKRAMTYAEIVRASVNLANESRKSGERKYIPVSDSVLRDRVPLLLDLGFVTRPLRRDGSPTQRKGIGITQKGRDLLKQPTPT